MAFPNEIQDSVTYFHSQSDVNVVSVAPNDPGNMSWLVLESLIGDVGTWVSQGNTSSLHKVSADIRYYDYFVPSAVTE